MNGSDSENVKVILSIGGTEYEGIECGCHSRKGPQILVGIRHAG